RVSGQSHDVDFKLHPGQLEIVVDKKPFANYFFQSEETPRPFFANVKTPSGIQATRNHPPIQDKDPVDHDTYHPGIWLAFGDMSGHDSWRLKAKVQHEEFVEQPQGGRGEGTFTVRNRYLSNDGKQAVCEELCKYSIIPDGKGTYLIYDSLFSSDKADFSFGDQEELGAGLRINTQVSVKFGKGHMTNAEGLKDGDQVWGKQSDWLDYSGLVDSTYVGIAIMPSPQNFRRSWYHARDYGFVAANPFGREAMKAGEKSVVTVKKGEKFRLGFGFYIYSDESGQPVDIGAAYQQYLKRIKTQ
ncbi:MAG: PmoA family protein, partial [Planctomycetota bacterium]|nr:PmoA family protein [Planctomycetota bacterium]